MFADGLAPNEARSSSGTDLNMISTCFVQVYVLSGISCTFWFIVQSQRGHLFRADDGIVMQHYKPFLRGINPSPVDSPHKGQWRGALKCSLIYARTNGWHRWFETPLWRHCNEMMPFIMGSSNLVVLQMLIPKSLKLRDMHMGDRSAVYFVNN